MGFGSSSGSSGREKKTRVRVETRFGVQTCDCERPVNTSKVVCHVWLGSLDLTRAAWAKLAQDAMTTRTVGPYMCHPSARDTGGNEDTFGNSRSRQPFRGKQEQVKDLSSA